MSDLQNLTPANTYKGLLQVGDYTNGVDSTVKAVLDGEGTASALAIGTTKVGIGTTSPTQELDVNGDIVSTTLTTSGAVTAGSVSTSGAVTGGSLDVSGNVVADEYALDQVGSSSSAVAIHAPATNELAIRTNSTEAIRIDSEGRVGIGTANPGTHKLFVNGNGTVSNDLLIGQNYSNGYSEVTIRGDAGEDSSLGSFTWQNYRSGNNYPMGKIDVHRSSGTDTSGAMLFSTGSGGSLAERLRITSAGNVGIGADSPDAKLQIDGDSSNLGGILIGHASGTGIDSFRFYIDSDNKAHITRGTSEKITILNNGNVLPGTDDAQDFGSSSKRWDDIYATNTTIQSSDRELKQDIEELSEAETHVAQACKGLLRKYRWKDAVAQKGDEARIHFGIIAQDLEDAFTAEGLDVGRYGMFVKNTWWTADRVIPAVEAVEAVYDEEGNEVSSAIEAQPERTVTEIFENSEDAPEGATEVTQRGVRYSELLAFIISAI